MPISHSLFLSTLLTTLMLYSSYRHVLKILLLYLDFLIVFKECDWRWVKHVKYSNTFWKKNHSVIKHNLNIKSFEWNKATIFKTYYLFNKSSNHQTFCFYLSFVIFASSLRTAVACKSFFIKQTISELGKII